MGAAGWHRSDRSGARGFLQFSDCTLFLLQILGVECQCEWRIPYDACLIGSLSKPGQEDRISGSVCRLHRRNRSQVGRLLGEPNRERNFASSRHPSSEDLNDDCRDTMCSLLASTGLGCLVFIQCLFNQLGSFFQSFQRIGRFTQFCRGADRRPKLGWNLFAHRSGR